MLQFNRKYMFMATGAGIVVTAIVQTIYSLVMHQAMAATLPGLVLSLVLFIVVTGFAAVYFGKRASEDADSLIALYDDLCDPAALADRGKATASQMTVPYDVPSAWFMSYYAQALLDMGIVQNAREIERAMYESVGAAKKVEDQAQIVTNLVPLSLKVLGPAETLPIIEMGLKLLAEGPALKLAPAIAYLENQQVIVSAQVNGEDEKLVRYYSGARDNADVPLRIRVEQAWDEARIHYRTGNAAAERACLEFIAANGNKLALVKPARDRLSAL